MASCNLRNSDLASVDFAKSDNKPFNGNFLRSASEQHVETELSMASFNIKSFEKKLKALDGSQTGIQTLSLWIIHHRHHANLITATWVDFLEKGK